MGKAGCKSLWKGVFEYFYPTGDSDAWESQEHYAARTAMAVAQGDMSLMLLGDGFDDRHS